MPTTRTAPRHERALQFLLRYIGLMCLLALVAVFMPASWMDATHRALGMGALPAEPIVGYLARSLSLFYALLGGLLLLLSLEPRRHRGTLLYLAGAFVLFGLIIFGIDHLVRMPPLWRRTEGPIVIVLGLGVLWLTSRLDSSTV